MSINFFDPNKDRFDNLIKYLDEKFNDIQNKNQEWFDNREIGKDGIGPNLKDHYTLYQDGPSFTFNFTPSSDLPEKYRDECVEVFKEWFK